MRKIQLGMRVTLPLMAFLFGLNLASANCLLADTEVQIICSGAEQEPVTTSSAEANQLYRAYQEAVLHYKLEAQLASRKVQAGDLATACSIIPRLDRRVNEMVENQTRACDAMARHCVTVCGESDVERGIAESCRLKRNEEVHKTRTQGAQILQSHDQIANCASDIGG